MATLTQLLLIAVVCAILYGVYSANETPIKGFLARLGIQRKPAAPGSHAANDDHDIHTSHDPHDIPHSEHGDRAAHHAKQPALSLSASVKIVVYVPDAHAEHLRQAIGEAGGGVIGNYTFCSFSSLGTGRYLPGPGANPMIGSVGVQERVEEERIEFTCSRENLAKVVAVIKRVHPYEEIVIDIYPLEAHPELEAPPFDPGAGHQH